MDIQLIAKLYEEDQKIRQDYDTLTEEILDINKEHISLIYPFIKHWKSIPKNIDNSTLFKIFILIVHADWNPQLQKWFLNLLKKAMRYNNSLKYNYALLYDRICFNNNQPQKFGTQITIEDSKVILYKTQDIKNIDSLRKQFNLEPLQEYLDLLAIFNNCDTKH